MQSFNWPELIGGVAFFFYGLQNIRNSLQMMAGGRIRAALGRVTNNRIVALAFGALITLVLQSSSATTVMLVSLAGTQLLTLAQAFGVILGADIGTTFVVVLLSIKKVTDYALIVISCGFALQWMAKRRKTKNVGSVILGFGLVFYGMYLMSFATAPLKDNPAAMQAFQYMASHPLTNLIIAAIFTAVIHASAATIGMAISLSFAGLISFEAAIPIVLGANIGTCITAFLSSFGMGVDGRRVAVAHFMVKFFGVALAFPFIGDIASAIDNISNHLTNIVPNFVPNDAGKIALTHLLFNTAIAILFLPFVKWGIILIKKLVPEPIYKPEPFGPLYLDNKFLDTPVLAFAQAKREIIRIAGYAFDLFKDSLKMFERSADVPERIEDLQSKDDKVDVLEKATRFYLAKLSREQLSDEEIRLQYALLNTADNLEEIGDIISKDMTLLAKKKWDNNSVFSDEGWKELKEFHSEVTENFNLTISAITSPHPEIIQKIERHQKKIYELEQTYKKAHINRLHDGMKETLETSSIHLELLSNLRRVNGQLTYISKVISEDSRLS